MLRPSTPAAQEAERAPAASGLKVPRDGGSDSRRALWADGKLWTIALAVGFVGVLTHGTGWLDGLTFDLHYALRQSRGAEPYREAVACVVMDEESLVRLGQPSLREWDRRLHARLVEVLRGAGAKAIAFDVLFADARPAEDAVFTEAIRAHGRVIVAAAWLRSHQSGVAVAQLVTPTAAIAEVAATGVTESAPGFDIPIRWPRFAREAGVPREGPASLAETVARSVGVTVPTNDLSRAGLNYYCPPARVPTLSYWQVLSNDVPRAALADKVVFVGSGFVHRNPDEPSWDFFPTPFTLWGHSGAPGVVVHMTAFLNLQRGEWWRRPSRSTELVLLLAAGIPCGVLLLRLRWRWAVILGLAGALCFTVGAAWQVEYTRVWLPVGVVALVQLPAALLGLSALNRLRTRSAVAPRARRGAAPSESASEESPSPPLPVAPTSKLPLAAVPYEVPDHDLIKPIGQGAYGQVWLARDAIGTYHAVKILRRQTHAHTVPFDREFHGLVKFTPISREHPGLVHILHVGRNDQTGYCYYVMEAADDVLAGAQVSPEAYTPRSLASDLQRRGSLSAAEVIELGRALAGALAFLHDRRLIHRDIKPSNIIYVRDRPKLADVGLVTDAASGTGEVSLVGTAGYLAPEGPGSPAADLYGLGKVLYVALTGCTVQEFPTLPETLAQSPDVETILELNRLLLRLCEPIVNRRCDSARQVIAELSRIAPPAP